MKWISTKERLPEKTGWYDICYKWKHIEDKLIDYIGLYLTSGKVWGITFLGDNDHYSNDGKFEVLYWKPRPKLPKE